MGRGSTWFRAGEGGAPPAAEDVYFGVNLAARPAGRASRGKVTALGCLYAEFDAKDFGGSKEAALAHIESLTPRPSALVDSGGGYHAYWRLTAPWLLDSDAERERARGLQSRWVARVGGDPAAKDLARVLRVPGTLNTKYDPPRPVEQLYLDEGRCYTVAELEALAPAPELVATPARPRQPLRAASGPRAGRTDGGAVIAQFNAEHTVEGLLDRYGATRTASGWKCNCGIAHSHESQLTITSQGQAVFFSARCGWAPARTDANGRPVGDAFDLYAQVEHGGDKTAALKAINPIAPRQAEQPVEVARPAPDPATVEARRRDAARKRDARRAEAEETLAAVRDRACEDAELIAYATARDVLRELLALAGAKTWCRPSVAGLAARLERSERTIQRALAWLEGRYISAEKQQLPDGTVQPLGSRPGRPHSTAIRTFLREPLQPVETPQTAETGVTRHDAESTPVSPDHVHELVHDHALERVSGGGELPATPELAPAPPVAPAPEPAAFEGGASFDPAAEPGPARDLRGLDNWRELCALWADRQPAAVAVADLAAELGVEDEHQVKGPPRDPVKAAEYWKLRGAARKATSARQKRRLLTLAAELEEWYPAGEAPRLYLRPHAPPPPRPQLQLALGEAPAVPAPPSPAPEPSPAAAQAYGPGYALSMAERLAALRSQEVRYASAAD